MTAPRPRQREASGGDTLAPGPRLLADDGGLDEDQEEREQP
jgi:hypothetical protein